MDSPRNDIRCDLHNTVFDKEWYESVDYTSESFLYSPNSEIPIFRTDTTEDSFEVSDNEEPQLENMSSCSKDTTQLATTFNFGLKEHETCNGKLAFLYAISVLGDRAIEYFREQQRLITSTETPNCTSNEETTVMEPSESIQTLLTSFLSIAEEHISEDEQQQTEYFRAHSTFRSDPCHFFDTPPLNETFDIEDDDDCQSVNTSLYLLSPRSEREDDGNACLTPPTSPVSIGSPLQIASPLRHSESPEAPIEVYSPIASLRSPVSYPRSSTPEPFAGPSSAASYRSVSPIPRASPESPTSGSSSTPVYEPWFEDSDSDFISISSSYCYDSDFDPPFHPFSEETYQQQKNRRQNKPRKRTPSLTYKRVRWQKPYPRQSMHYAVRSVVARRLTKPTPNPKEKDYEYLLAWEGYASDENTWEPYSHLMPSCRGKLDEFLERTRGRETSESSLD